MARLRRVLAGSLFALLAVTALTPAATAGGPGSPLIISPAETDPLYTGFTGPFTLDLTAAEHATYDWTVTRQVPEEAAGSGQFTWTGDEDAQPDLTVPALTAGDYVFEVTDGNGHDASLSFTVRGPQPRCSVVAPTTVRVNRAEVVVPTRLASNCTAAGVTYASWDIRHATQGFQNLITFDHVTKDSWKFAAGEPLGTYYATPVLADSASDDVILQNTPRTIIRLVSRVSLTATRDGRYVTLRGLLTRYTPSAIAFRGWKGHAVVIQSQACASCPWRTVVNRATNARGRVSVTVRSAAVKRYRILSAGTPGVWAPPADYLRR